MPTFKLEIDGGALNNPGPAAIGIVMLDEQDEIFFQHGERIGEATNNVAEYTALCRGVELLKKELKKEGVSHSDTDLKIQTDSQLMANQVNNEWKTRDEHLQKLKERALEELDAFSSWSLYHVPREKNADADSLVTESLNNSNSSGTPTGKNRSASESETAEEESLFEAGPVFAVFAHGIGSQKDKPGGIAYLIRDGDGRDLLLESSSTDSVSSAAATYIAFESGVRALLQILEHRPDKKDSSNKPRPEEVALNLFGVNDLVINQLSGRYRTRKEELAVQKEKVQDLLDRFGAFRIQRNDDDVLKDLKAQARKEKKEASSESGG